MFNFAAQLAQMCLPFTSMVGHNDYTDINMGGFIYECVSGNVLMKFRSMNLLAGAAVGLL